MANASGGDIIFGIEEYDGKPRIKGFLFPNIDTLKQQIESIQYILNLKEY